MKITGEVKENLMEQPISHLRSYLQNWNNQCVNYATASTPWKQNINLPVCCQYIRGPWKSLSYRTHTCFLFSAYQCFCYLHL